MCFSESTDSKNTCISHLDS